MYLHSTGTYTGSQDLKKIILLRKHLAPIAGSIVTARD